MKIFEKENRLNICLGKGENPEVDMVVWKNDPEDAAEYIVRTPDMSVENAMISHAVIVSFDQSNDGDQITANISINEGNESSDSSEILERGKVVAEIDYSDLVDTPEDGPTTLKYKNFSFITGSINNPIVIDPTIRVLSGGGFIVKEFSPKSLSEYSIGDAINIPTLPNETINFSFTSRNYLGFSREYDVEIVFYNPGE